MVRRPGRDAVYDAANAFRDRCLTAHRSLLWPEREVWTPENIDRLIAAYIDRLDETSRPFLDKWHDQLADQPDDVHRLAADVLAFYYLFPTNVSPTTKLARLKTLVSWQLADDGPDYAFPQSAFAQGLGSPGLYYLTTQPFQIEFYLRFFREIVAGQVSPDDEAGCTQLADTVLSSLTGHSSYPARHIALHLLFPESFEPIASQNHKERIAATFAERADGTKIIDLALLSIRRSFEHEFGPTFDFYGTQSVYQVWHPDPPELPDLPDASRWWINKEDWRARRVPGFGFVQATYGPVLDRGGRDIFRALADVQDGDVILHFDTSRAAFVGLSWAAGSATISDDEFDAQLPPDRGPSRIVRFSDFVSLEPPLRHDQLFEQFGDRLMAFRKTASDVFFDATGRTSGLFFTPARQPLVDILNEAYQALADGTSLIELAITAAPPSTNGDARVNLISVTNLTAEELDEIELLLREKRQVVFEGAPGSGKTYVADKIARHFTGNPLDGDSDARMEFVQFHQSYGYEDFVQGIRPETRNGQLDYRVQPGIFMRFCERARRNPTDRFVMVIDEINRGNVSRIFGELLLLLEYRDQRVTLPYAAPDAPKFAIPENIFVIGTMNTADRSLAQIDYALRRRFYFYRFEPVVEGTAPILERWLVKQHGVTDADRERIIRLFVALNQRVTEHLGEDFQIGHSHFMRLDIASGEGLRRVWRYAIMPLLGEYLHSHRNRASIMASFAIDVLLATSDASVAASDLP